MRLGSVRRRRCITGAALFALLLAGTPFLAAQVTQDEAVAYVQKTPSLSLDPALPKQEFALWLAQLLGPEAETSWEMDDCGEQTGDPAIDSNRDMPVCVSANAALADGRRILISILVGTAEKGFVGKPAVYDLYWTEGRVIHALRRLSELPAVVRSRPGKSSP